MRQPNQPFRALNWVVLIGVAATVITIDQFTKALVTEHLAIGESWTPIPVLSDFFAITRSVNKGAALGIFPWAGDLFLIVAICMSIGIVVFYRRIEAGHWLERISLGLLLGGASGNAIDRLRLGYVVDFVHLQLRPIISNVSNISDHAIVVAILIMLYVQWHSSKDAPTETKSEAHSEDNPAITHD